MYQKREKNRHELFLLSSKNHITVLDNATAMRQKTNDKRKVKHFEVYFVRRCLSFSNQ